MQKKTKTLLLLSVLIIAICASGAGLWFYLRRAQVIGPTTYGGDYFGSRFYQQKEITPQNIHNLKIAWEYSTGDAKKGIIKGQVASSLGFECSPIICNNRLIVITPTQALIALEPETGKLLWRFEPPNYTNKVQINRGPSCWIGAPSDAHPFRIFYASRNIVYAVDANTGKVISDFGANGGVNLAKGIDRGHPEMILDNSPPHRRRHGDMRNASNR